jgi:hypothetical protein
VAFVWANVKSYKSDCQCRKSEIPGRRARARAINEQVNVPVPRAGVFETVKRSLDQIAAVGA